jgi:AcrR family transcriptional regulator
LWDNISVNQKKRKTDYHHGDLRAALIQCGSDLIEKKGIPALTMREIGKRLGVSRAAPYAHFADKAALLAAIREAGFIEFGKTIEAAKIRMASKPSMWGCVLVMQFSSIGTAQMSESTNQSRVIISRSPVVLCESVALPLVSQA